MRIALACLAAAAYACSRADPLPSGDPATGLPDGGAQPGQPDAGAPGWVVESEEDFQTADLGAPDIAKAREFYSDVFSWTVQPGGRRPAGIR